VLVPVDGGADVGDTRSDGVSPTIELVVAGGWACWPECSLSCAGCAGCACWPLFSLSCGTVSGRALAEPAVANITAAMHVITAVLRVSDAIWWGFM
jgi:hypothetical protein